MYELSLSSTFALFCDFMPVLKACFTKLGVNTSLEIKGNTFQKD